VARLRKKKEGKEGREVLERRGKNSGALNGKGRDDTSRLKAKEGVVDDGEGKE